MKSDTTRWNVAAILGADAPTQKLTPVALIILNQPLFRIPDFFLRLWHRASLKICADGGGNSLFDGLKNEGLDASTCVPDRIRGDLDSLRPDVAEFYKSLGCDIDHVKEQDSTDFMKCLQYVREQEIAKGIKYDVVACGALGGRFDQSMSSINQAYVMKDERKIILLSKDSIAFLLPEGKHEIRVDRSIEGPTCGILPFGRPAKCTTSGLRWNLDNATTAFGGLLSTSNAFEDDTDVIHVETDAPMVWTTELHPS